MNWALQSRNGGNASALSGKHGSALTGGLGRGGLAASAMPATGPLNLHAQKPRMAFFLHTTLITRIARRLAPKALLNVRKCARRPFVAIQGQLIKQNCKWSTVIERLGMSRVQVKRGIRRRFSGSRGNCAVGDSRLACSRHSVRRKLPASGCRRRSRLPAEREVRNGPWLMETRQLRRLRNVRRLVHFLFLKYTVISSI